MVRVNSHASGRVSSDASAFCGAMKRSIPTIKRKSIESGAKWGARRVRQVIYNQEYDWEPLSERWLNFKEENGFDERVYIQTGEAVRKIRAWEDKNGNWHYGPRPNARHHSGLMLWQLFRVLEYGSEAANIPARPVWRPVWRELVGADGYLRRVATTLGDAAARAATQKVRQVRDRRRR